jgi:hypothetical protein
MFRTKDGDFQELHGRKKKTTLDFIWYSQSRYVVSYKNA